MGKVSDGPMPRASWGVVPEGPANPAREAKNTGKTKAATAAAEASPTAAAGETPGTCSADNRTSVKAPDVKSTKEVRARTDVLNAARRGIADTVRAFPQPTDFVVRAFETGNAKSIDIVLEAWALDQSRIGALGASLLEPVAALYARSAAQGNTLAREVLSDLPPALVRPLERAAKELASKPGGKAMAELVGKLAEFVSMIGPTTDVEKSNSWVETMSAFQEEAKKLRLGPEEQQLVLSLISTTQGALRLCAAMPTSSSTLHQHGIKAGGLFEKIAQHAHERPELLVSSGLRARLPDAALDTLLECAKTHRLTPEILRDVDGLIGRELPVEVMSELIRGRVQSQEPIPSMLWQLLGDQDFLCRSPQDQRAFVAAFSRFDSGGLFGLHDWHALRLFERKGLDGLSRVGREAMSRALGELVERPFTVSTGTALQPRTGYDIRPSQDPEGRANDVAFADGVVTRIVIPDSGPFRTLEIKRAAEVLATLPAPLRKYCHRLMLTGKVDPESNTLATAEPARITAFQLTKTQSDGRLRDTLVHEIGHVVAFNHLGPVDTQTPGFDLWWRAIKSDQVPPSGYGAGERIEHGEVTQGPISLHEDFAETFVLYAAVIGTPREAGMRALYPQRFAVLDAMLGVPN